MSGNRKQIYLQHKNYNMNIIEVIYNIFAPHECLGCKKEGELLCQTCRVHLVLVPPRCYRCQRWSEGSRTCQRCRRNSSLFAVHTVTKYEDTAKALVHVLKFERSRAAATTLARTMAFSPIDDTVIMTHIPTANGRVRERGYDQAALIARALSRSSNRVYIPLLARLDERRQLGQSRKVRKSQMRDAFRVLNPAPLAGKHVVLVDDVLTTGATCEAAAYALRQAGAKRVSAVVFAVA